MSDLAVVSYGGGVQSTALLVLAAQGYIDHDRFLFANVGDDSEDPRTLRYVREVAFDYAGAHGVAMEELHRIPRRGRSKGQVETLWGRLMREDSRSLPIPVRMGDTGAPGTRSCTADFKIRVVQRRIKELGASATSPARVAVGISTDLGKDHVYLTRFGRRLADVVAEGGTQDTLDGWDDDEGYRCGDVCDT